jgi:hypothetical protein
MYQTTTTATNSNMEHSGNIWGFIDEDIHTTILEFGGKIKESWEWNGCECSFCERQEDLYCHGCFESYEEHKESVEEACGDDEDVECTLNDVDYWITREQFELNAVPWLLNHAEAENYIKEAIVDATSTRCVGLSVDYTIEPGCDFIREYCLLRKIKYFFDLTDKDCCYYHTYGEHFD